MLFLSGGMIQVAFLSHSSEISVQNYTMNLDRSDFNSDRSDVRSPDTTH